jgi:hypothetical protein
VLAIVVIIGSVMYVVGGEENGFTSIPISIYWATSTWRPGRAPGGARCAGTHGGAGRSLEAARELLEEARALRLSLETRG